MRVLYPFFILALMTGCTHLQTPNLPPQAAKADSARTGAPITREQVMQIAEAYAEHSWTASQTNVFHGTDAKGAWIDTPDLEWWGNGGWYADGQTNTGLPYCWGGDSTLAEFDEGIAEGRPAGYHFKNMDRKKHEPPDSALPMGVDCSGLVSRCWCLKARRSTYNLIDVSYQLLNFEDLKPGDAVNKPYDHVILFIGWADKNHEQMYVFESGDAKRNGDPKNYERVHEDIYKTEWLKKHGFVPLRYKEIVEQQQSRANF